MFKINFLTADQNMCQKSHEILGFRIISRLNFQKKTKKHPDHIKFSNSKHSKPQKHPEVVRQTVWKNCE
jgi:hypothetical protein